jgi:hypothetical protein
MYEEFQWNGSITLYLLAGVSYTVPAEDFPCRLLGFINSISQTVEPP